MDPILTEAAVAAWSLTMPETLASPLPALMTALRVGHDSDRQRYGWPVSVLRSVRRSKIVLAPPVWPELARNQAFALHVAGAGGRDPLFFLSHRHYLARGLTSAQRVQAAATHYRNEIATFTPDYVKAVYSGAGLQLWQRAVEGVDYDIRLMPGNDVAHEGGLSLVMRVDGQRICVLSYSLVPATVLGLGGVPGIAEALHFVTRKQLSPDHSYQTAFNRAFDRTTPAHLCFGAMQGIVMALGGKALAAITAEAQPSNTRECAAHFVRAYDEFWQSMSGVAHSPRAYVLPVPARGASLDDKTSAQRRRILARRQHVEDIEGQTRQSIASFLRR